MKYLLDVSTSVALPQPFVGPSSASRRSRDSPPDCCSKMCHRRYASVGSPPNAPLSASSGQMSRGPVMLPWLSLATPPAKRMRAVTCMMRGLLICTNTVCRGKTLGSRKHLITAAVRGGPTTEGVAQSSLYCKCSLLAATIGQLKRDAKPSNRNAAYDGRIQRWTASISETANSVLQF